MLQTIYYFSVFPKWGVREFRKEHSFSFDFKPHGWLRKYINKKSLTLLRLWAGWEVLEISNRIKEPSLIPVFPRDATFNIHRSLRDWRGWGGGENAAIFCTSRQILVSQLLCNDPIGAVDDLLGIYKYELFNFCERIERVYTPPPHFFHHTNTLKWIWKTS